MSEEKTIQSKIKVNKYLLIGIGAILTVVVVLALALFIQKPEEEETVGDSLNLGERYLSELNYEQAAITYKNVIQIDPRNMDAYLGLADAYIAQKEYDKAIEILNSALEILGGVDEDINRKLAVAEALKQGAETTYAPTPTPFTVSESVIGIMGTEDNLTYEITEEGCVITGLKDKNVTEIFIPQSIQGYPIVRIREAAFAQCKSLRKVVMEESVKVIENYAFSGCSSLTEIILPNSIKEIGTNAFLDTPWLENQQNTEQNNQTSDNIEEIIRDNFGMTIVGGVVIDGTKCEGVVVIPNHVIQIASWAFKSSKITAVILPEGLQSIESDAFFGCKSLTEITIPDSVTYIGHEAFSGCSNLKEVHLPEHITNMEGLVFKGTPWLNEKIAESEYVVINTTLQDASKVKGSIAVPEGITSMDYAFYNNEFVTEVTVPGTVKQIAFGTFSNCPALECVTFLNGVEQIMFHAFENCTSLKKIVIPDSINYIEEDSFAECEVEEITIVCSKEHVLLETLKEHGFTKFEYVD